MLLQAAFALLAVAVTAAAASHRRARRLRGELAAARSRLELLGAPLTDDVADPRRVVRASALRRDERRKFQADEEGHYDELLSLLLQDFRDVAGAEEALFWRWNAEGDALEPANSSTRGGNAAAHFDLDAWGPLVQWSAAEGVLQTVGHGDAVMMGAVCVLQEESTLGVLTLSHRDGLGLPRAALKEWMPRMAAQLSAFQDLVSVRLRYGHQMRRSEALLDAVQMLLADRPSEALEPALCDTAVDVSAGRGAALVRWYAESDRGEIRHATEGTGIAMSRRPDGRGQSPQPLGVDSLIANACRAGALEVFEDARGVATGQGLYGLPRKGRDPGSVAIMPLLKFGRVLGALVIEADSPAALTLEETRHLNVLGAVVASSLELVWSYQEVDRRARTDALTGLYNRMHFGEELQRMLADPQNHPVSLLLADVDHFKKVNDHWGHEAGDAVLRHLARILQEGVRRSGDVCARYGGEEIAMVMAQTDREAAVEVAERLRRRIESTVIHHAGAEIAVTASFGVSTYPDAVRGKERLFPSADEALYQAKRDGRNCVRTKGATVGSTNG